MKHAGDRANSGNDEDWNEAEALLHEWLIKDEQRRDVAGTVSKRERIAQIDLNRSFSSPTCRGEPALLNTAEQRLAVAEPLARRLSAPEAARRIGSLKQRRGLLYQARGDLEGVGQAWGMALAACEPAGLAKEAANCRYILGALGLNRANEG
jgi:hypothetical protein